MMALRVFGHEWMAFLIPIQLIHLDIEAVIWEVKCKRSKQASRPVTLPDIFMTVTSDSRDIS